MRLLSSASIALLALLSVTPALAQSGPEDALRDALKVGTTRAVESLGKKGGYLDHADVKIPLPKNLKKIEKAMRAVGGEPYVDSFVESMNRAAEAAAPLAKEVFVDSVKKMKFADVKTILKGKNHEATDYLQRTAGPKLTELFAPIVKGKLEEVGATKSFDALMGQAASLPFVKKPPVDLSSYVTGKALDGMFLRIAQEEEKIRKDPVARTTELLKKWFGR